MGLSLALLLPVGILTAITNSELTLNVISELVGGFANPGSALVMNMFKAYGTLTLVQTISFIADLKLGHYAKIPPRAMFRAQILATLLSVVIVILFYSTLMQTLSVMNWQLDHVTDLCHDEQKQKFTCVGTYTLFTASLIWGTIGPAKMFGSGALYHNSLYGFLLGAVLPIPFYVLSRWRYPKLRLVYTPILLAGGIGWAPTNMSWLIPSLYVGYIFQVYIRKKHFEWWSNYNVRIVRSL